MNMNTKPTRSIFLKIRNFLTGLIAALFLIDAFAWQPICITVVGGGCYVGIRCNDGTINHCKDISNNITDCILHSGIPEFACAMHGGINGLIEPFNNVDNFQDALLSAPLQITDYEDENVGMFDVPYISNNNAIIDTVSGDPGVVEVIDNGLVNGTKELKFRELGEGMRFDISNTGGVDALGFEYHTSDDWFIRFNGSPNTSDTTITLDNSPIGGNPKFIGFIVYGEPITEIVFSSTTIVQNGISIDNFMTTDLIDTDLDGVEDTTDNCSLVANSDQRDTNGDGYGNACDPDLDNNGVVNFGDLVLWTPFFSMNTTGDADFNGDGAANFVDFVLYSTYFLQPPGPSGVAP